MTVLYACSGEVSGAQALDTGLVSLSTSDTLLSKDLLRKAEAKNLANYLETIEIDPVKSRLSRLRKNVGASAWMHIANVPKGFEKDRVIMITLTYAGNNDDWEAKHISSFMKIIRQWCNRRDLHCKYVWVAELQKRGVIHYHVALWLPKDVKLPMPDKVGWWVHGMTEISVARKPVPYLMKYLSKDTSKTFGCFPKGARIYGVGGLKEFLTMRRWLNYPKFIKCMADVNERWIRCAGGGWISPDGEIFESEFEYCYVAGKASVKRVREHEKLIEPWGAFSWMH